MLDPERPVLIERGDARLGGTNFGLPLSVVALTNSTIAFLAAPSFQDGSGPAPSAIKGAIWICLGKHEQKSSPAPIILSIIVFHLRFSLWPF